MSTQNRAICIALAIVLFPSCISKKIDPNDSIFPYTVEAVVLPKSEQLRAILNSQKIPVRFYVPPKDLAMPVEDPTPDNSRSIWLGKNVPLPIVKTVLVRALDLYPFICYISISGDAGRASRRIHNNIFIGGSTETAESRQLARLSKKEVLAALQNAATIDEFHTFIRERNRSPQPKTGRRTEDVGSR